MSWVLSLVAMHKANAELILGLHPANERRSYFVTTFLIAWVQT